MSANLQVLPTTPATRVDLAMLGPVDVYAALRKHPGYAIERKIVSVRTMLDLFRRALRDLKSAIASFPDLGGPDGRVARELFEHDVSVLVNKELFAALGAAQSLVDYSRRVKSLVDADAFESRKAVSFSLQEHKLIIGLRNIVIHQVHSEANWQKVYRVRGAPPTKHFIIERDELLADGELNADALAHLATLGENIDVTELLSQYAEKVEAFYSWLLPEIEKKLPLAVEDYRACKKAVKNYQARLTYSFLAKSWINAGVDPYEHLPKYLTSEQLRIAKDLPHRSTEQVDFIITCVDRDEVCDDTLRTIIHALFKAPEADVASPSISSVD